MCRWICPCLRCGKQAKQPVLVNLKRPYKTTRIGAKTISGSLYLTNVSSRKSTRLRKPDILIWLKQWQNVAFCLEDDPSLMSPYASKNRKSLRARPASASRYTVHANSLPTLTTTTQMPATFSAYAYTHGYGLQQIRPKTGIFKISSLTPPARHTADSGFQA